MPPKPVFRFAPSPNGELHLGHAFSALRTWEMARAAGGRCLLRIEDIDLARCRPEYEARILDDLAWLGLEWEQPIRRQSEHFATYAEALGKLEALGVLYPCFASRAEIAQAVSCYGPDHPADPDGAPLYPGLHRGLSASDVARRRARGEPNALRLDMAKAIGLAEAKIGGAIAFTEIDADRRRCHTLAADPARWGDAVIARKDVPASYHIAVVADDAVQGVTHVTRGQDLFAATGIHRLLQILLGLPEPLYHHHRLIVDEHGRKLAKSHRDRSLRSLRAEGITPAQICVMVGLPAVAA